jgi:hypothetical protein
VNSSTEKQEPFKWEPKIYRCYSPTGDLISITIKRTPDGEREQIHPPKPDHIDHPMRHWDRTCPACVYESDISQECVDETTKYRHDLVYRLRKRAEIRRQIPDRKSVQEGQPDRIADLLEEAADAFESAKERGWVGLTDDEIWDCYTSQGKQFYLAIEAKLKEKNT